jgi:hypothetical protein
MRARHSGEGNEPPQISRLRVNDPVDALKVSGVNAA